MRPKTSIKYSNFFLLLCKTGLCDCHSHFSNIFKKSNFSSYLGVSCLKIFSTVENKYQNFKLYQRHFCVTFKYQIFTCSYSSINVSLFSNFTSFKKRHGRQFICNFHLKKKDKYYFNTKSYLYSFFVNHSLN